MTDPVAQAVERLADLADGSLLGTDTGLAIRTVLTALREAQQKLKEGGKDA